MIPRPIQPMFLGRSVISVDKNVSTLVYNSNVCIEYGTSKGTVAKITTLVARMT